MATKKPDTDEILNHRKRMARLEEEAMGTMASTSAAPAGPSSESGGGMSQASFSGYPGRGAGRGQRPSREELEKKMAAKKAK